MHLARIDIFPVKSLDGLSLPQVAISPGGALSGDRTYALMDDHHRRINGKRVAAIHQIRASFEPEGPTVTLNAAQMAPITGDLRQPTDLLAWFSTYFQHPVQLQENRQIGFPDDSDASGPTLISTATLATVATWYPDLSLEEVRRRFRSNLEIDGVPPFWEDQLFSPDGQPVTFQIGAVTLQGINPCQRCVVPTRDTLSGQPRPQFQQHFQQQRATTLPIWAPRRRFNHFYRLAVNTKISPTEAGKRLRVGDSVKIIGQA